MVPAGASNLPDSLVQREADLNARVISTAAERPAVPEQITDLLWKKVVKQMAAKGIREDQIQLILGSTVDPSRYVEYYTAAVAFMREIANLKQAEAAMLLRQNWSTK
jgi:hypothetical protein